MRGVASRSLVMAKYVISSVVAKYTGAATWGAKHGGHVCLVWLDFYCIESLGNKND